jgi:hypothetical protein
MCVLGIPTMHWDRDNNCACDECGYVEHFHGQGDACGHCDTCNKVLGILDRDGDGLCDLCGEGPCGKIHPHADENGDGSCDFCNATPQEETVPEAAVISIVANEENALLQITPVEGAEGYVIFINGACRYSTDATSYTIDRYQLNYGMNEIYVQAYNGVGYAADSNVVTVGRLADPDFYATGTGVEFRWGDVENAQGYIIYGDDGQYLTTIGLGENYDFAYLYTEDGLYFPYVQAYAEGWISSEREGVPVSIGSHGGPVGSPD